MEINAQSLTVDTQGNWKENLSQGQKELVLDQMELLKKGTYPLIFQLYRHRDALLVLGKEHLGVQAFRGAVQGKNGRQQYILIYNLYSVLVQRGVAFVLLVQTEGELEVRNHLGHVVL